jgi:hypothetical protein
MNPGIDTTVSGVKNSAEAEEITRCVDLPPTPEAHLQQLRELNEQDLGVMRATSPRGMRPPCKLGKATLNPPMQMMIDMR